VQRLKNYLREKVMKNLQSM